MKIKEKEWRKLKNSAISCGCFTFQSNTVDRCKQKATWQNSFLFACPTHYRRIVEEKPVLLHRDHTYTLYEYGLVTSCPRVKIICACGWRSEWLRGRLPDLLEKLPAEHDAHLKQEYLKLRREYNEDEKN